MSYVNYNPNPVRKLVGDCVIRAISKCLNKDWEDTYLAIAMKGYMMHDMPSSNDVWGTYLIENGFRRYVIPDTCPTCYTVQQFCELAGGLLQGQTLQSAFQYEHLPPALGG